MRRKLDENGQRGMLQLIEELQVRAQKLHMYFLGVKISTHRIKIWNYNYLEEHLGANISMTAIRPIKLT
jgi:hypothetical protein